MRHQVGAVRARGDRSAGRPWRRSPEAPTGEAGAAAVEYAMLAAAVAAVLVLVLFSLGGAVSNLFGDSCRAVRDRAVATGTC